MNIQQNDLFLATLSHELKTSLTSILGWTRLLRAAGPGSDLFDSALDAIEQGATVQQRLIDDLLDVSRIVTGKLHLDQAPADLQEILESSVEAFAPKARDHGLHIHVSCEGALVVLCDVTRIKQIIWNLISNAVKFTPPGGLIEVSGRRDGETVTITVADTGRGITAEVLPHVFDRFHQAAVSDRSRHGGLGLGLAIVRSLAERHGGSVEAHSDGEGKGTTFLVRLPAYNDSQKEKKNETRTDCDHDQRQEEVAADHPATRS